ncbi:Type-1 restriction enzyme EcoKI specificity protein [Enhygromyxa salina]|uniref:Type-1 restriction enzyme EcoKI specificity protein n=1 Tax=Enhygromyxa salina TaxID=215803 RepID=A0A2S9XCT7_9BACT|nr:restriction endonuclease subunit S [Enhygromyxa salina]PRP90666.1 Type-1 restriction enzyme EcoKI specificity protein [Enhygromyxa salina]
MSFGIAVGVPETKLPAGWRWTPLREVARLESGHTPSRKQPGYWGGDIPWLGIRDANAHHGGAIFETRETITEAGLANSSARLLPTGTVCLSRTASVGYVVILGEPMATSQDFVNWTCGDALEPRFLKYALLHEGRERLAQLGTGTVHKTIYYSTVEALHIALPPRREQARIAAELDRLLALVEPVGAQTDELLRTLDGLWRQALSAAFRGQLTGADASRWRRASVKEIARIDTESVDPAEHPDLPHVAPNHIESGTGVLLPHRTVGEDGVVSKKYRFQPGHIIYSKIRPYLAKAVLVDFEGLCSADSYPISVRSEDVSAAYLHKVMISPMFTEQAIPLQGRTVLPKINKRQLYGLEVPIPSPAEQAEIVARLEWVQRAIRDVRGAVEGSQGDVEHFTRSILRRAFHGELVEPDRSDEPIAATLAASEVPGPYRRQSEESMGKTSKKAVKAVDRGRIMKAVETLGASFDFAELRAALSTPPYDELQAALFELLGGEDPPFAQVFDSERACIRFERAES